jgi:hypothetical protein
MHFYQGWDASFSSVSWVKHSVLDVLHGAMGFFFTTADADVSLNDTNYTSVSMRPGVPVWIPHMASRDQATGQRYRRYGSRGPYHVIVTPAAVHWHVSPPIVRFHRVVACVAACERRCKHRKPFPQPSLALYPLSIRSILGFKFILMATS